MKITKYFDVTDSDTALALGSGTLPVLATPKAVAMAENTCMTLCEEWLTEDQSTVGSFIDIHHNAPSKVGAQIEVVATLKEETEKGYRFDYKLIDGVNIVATGEHQRVVINKKRFMNKIE